jgi:hypothetical protein
MNDAEAAKPLASGIDTLVLSVDVDWKNCDLFDRLTEQKKKAKNQNKDIAAVMKGKEKGDKWVYTVRPFGARGYEWILKGKEFNLRVGNWKESTTMPGVMIEIGSETLWREGPINICNRIIRLIESNDGIIRAIKVSRADLCVDVLLDKDLWNESLDLHMVTLAKKWNVWKSHKGIESLNIGTGDIMARLYDKPLEIEQVSKKMWMYKVWKIETVPEGKKVIRVEFQIRREIIKEMGLGRLKDFLLRADECWSYCTRKWLKFQTRPGMHHTMRKTFEWWECIQDGFYGVQGAFPAIRNKAIKEDADQLRNQILGFATSLTALKFEEIEAEYEDKVTFRDCFGAVLDYYNEKKITEKEFKKMVQDKRAKYFRASGQRI